MNLYDQGRAEKLIQLARERFDPNLKEAELAVLRGSASSTPIVDVPPLPSQDKPLPEVRPELLRWLVTDPDAKSFMDATGLRVMACTIAGDLRLSECRNLPSLWLMGCEIKGGVSLQAAETCGVYFLNSHIEGGISAARAVIHGPVYLQGFSSPEQIWLLGAQIEGQLVFTGAKLTQPPASPQLTQDPPQPANAPMRIALMLDGARIGGDAMFNDGFECSGQLRLLGVSIHGQLNFMGSTVDTVLCNDLQLDGELLWCGVTKTPKTELRLTGARVRTLSDDLSSWPERGKLDLYGFVYDDLILHAAQTSKQQENNQSGSPLPLIAAERIAWLQLQDPGLQPRSQSWMQLRSYLEARGDKAGAKHVAYRLNLLHAAHLKWHPNRNAAIAFAWLEERPSRILYPIVLTLLLGTLIFAGASPSRSGAMVPTAKDSKGAPISGTELNYYPRFQPFVYTLENALPLVKLGMDDKWAPDPTHACQAWFPGICWLNWLGWFNSYWFLSISRWLLILSGWFQATVLAGALASRFK